MAALLAGALLSSCARDDATDGARVDPAVQLEGTFTAEIKKSDLREFDYIPKDWPGTWTLRLEGDSYVLEFTNFRVTEDFRGTDSEILISATPAPTGTFNCYDGSGNRLTGDGEASGVYSYELTDNSLELTAEEEPCELRPALLERTWTVVE